MFHKVLAAAMTAAILSVGAVAISAASAGTSPGGEVMPRHGFSQNLGSKQAVGYFESADGRCMLTLMIAEALDEDSLSIPPSAVRVQVALQPEESTRVDSAESRMLTITCGAEAKTIHLNTGVTS